MSRYGTSAITVAGFVLCVVLFAQTIEARPSATLSRPKRVSDQRLAELETLIALQKMRGKLVTVPIGFGKVDPIKIGRKRRSSTETSWQQLNRIIKSIVEDDVELSLEDRNRLARLFFSRWDENEIENADDRGEGIGLF